MSERFDFQHDLASPPDAVRWDLGDEPTARLPTEKVCAVRLGSRVLGIPERFVRGLRQVDAATPVPRAPAHVLGVTALDGAIVPLLDISLSLGLGELRLKAPWVALLVAAGGFTVLIAVEEIIAFESADEPTETPEAGADEPPLAFTDGRAPVLGRPIPLLDLPALLEQLRGNGTTP